MRFWVNAYRVLATVVGVLLIPLFAGWGIELLTDGDWHDRAARLTEILGPLHGMLYMLFFVTTVILSRKAWWSAGFTIVTLLCGTIVIASFWAERRATTKLRAEHPELVGA